MANEFTTFAETKRAAYLERTPWLKDIRFLPLSETDQTTHALSTFIDTVWDTFYGATPRIRFPSTMLDWMLDHPSARSESLAALDKNGNLAAVFVGTPRMIEIQGKQQPSALYTGLSVRQDLAKGGLGGLMMIERALHAQRLGYETIFDWYDLRHKRKDTAAASASANPFVSLAEISLWGKTLDIEKTLKHQQLTLLERIILSHQSARIQAMPAVQAMPAPHIDPELLHFIDKQTQGFALRRTFTDYAGAFELTGPADQGFLYVMSGHKGIVGAIQGFSNRVDDECNVAYVDMMLFDPAASWGQKKGFLRTVEKRLADERQCMAIVLESTVANENPLKYGYLPFDKQGLAAYNLGKRRISSATLKDSFFDLK